MMCGWISGDGAYSDEKLAKDEFGSPDGEGMRGHLNHEIAKIFSMFCRKRFPVETLRITSNI